MLAKVTLVWKKMSCKYRCDSASTAVFFKQNNIAVTLCVIYVKVNYICNCNYISKLQHMQMHWCKHKQLEIFNGLDAGKVFLEFPKV
jgi:hypothetical protein